MTCNTSGLKIMRATLEDILHRPAHEVFAGPNAWVVEKLEHVAQTHAVDMAVDSVLEFAGSTQMVNMTLLPLVDAAKSEVGSMVIFKAIPQ
jgi:hypothetical protein